MPRRLFSASVSGVLTLRVALIVILFAVAVGAPIGSTQSPTDETGKTGIAIMGRLPDTPLNRGLKQYLGQRTDIKLVIEVQSREEFYRKLGMFSRAGGAYDFLIILGHGASDLPHITLNTAPEESLDPQLNDFNVAHHQANVRDVLRIREEIKAKLFTTLYKEEKTEEDQQQLGIYRNQLEMSDTRLTDPDIGVEASQQALGYYDTIRELLADNASVLLLNCSAAATAAHRRFVDNIGAVLLGRRGGQINASRSDLQVYTAYSDREDGLVGLHGLWNWTLTAFAYGRPVPAGDIAIRGWWRDFLGNWYTKTVPADLADPLYNDRIFVDFAPQSLEVPHGEVATLTSLVRPMPDSGTLTYFWEFSRQGTSESTHTVDTREYEPGKLVKIKVTVQDERGRTGDSWGHVWIRKPEYAPIIDFVPRAAQTGEGAHATARMTKDAAPADAMWNWTTEGGVKITRKRGDKVDLRVSARGTLRAQLYRLTRFGQQEEILTTEIEIVPDGPGAAELPAEKPPTEKSPVEKPIPPPVAPPAGTWVLQSMNDEEEPLAEAACPASLLTERNYWDEAKTKLRTEYTYYVDYGRNIRCGEETKYFENGKLAYKATRRGDAFVGTLTRYWETGVVFDVTTFENEAKNGPYESRWHNNKLRSKGQFKDNRKVDTWSYYLLSGALEAQGAYYRKFSTVVSGARECVFNDPFALDEGLNWQCGNRFGTWTISKDGEIQEQTFEQRGDIDWTVERAFWDRDKSREKALESQLESLRTELSAADERAGKEAKSKAKNPEDVTSWSCSACAEIRGRISKVEKALGEERDRAYAEIRSKFIVPGVDAEKPNQRVSSSAPRGSVSISGNSISTRLEQGGNATSTTTWSDFPKIVGPGQAAPIRVVVTGGSPGTPAATYTAIVVQGSAGESARALPDQAVAWDELARELFSSGSTPDATKDVRVHHNGPGGTATRTYVYAWQADASGDAADPGKLSATIELASGSARVVLGQALSFRAAVVSTSTTAPIGALVYRWQPNPEARFSPVEGASPRATAVFTRVGRVMVWVDVLRRSGAVLSTVAESNQLEIEVVPPVLALRATPAQPYPGQEVRITASEMPAGGEAFVSYWWEYAGNAISPGGIADPRVYTFRPKDTTPVKVIAHAKAIDGGDDLGSQEIVVTARPHDVQVSKPQIRGPKPQVWNPQRGELVDVDTGIAVFQDVSLRAEVTPAPENQPLRYEWTMSQEGCSISNPISQEPTFNCSQTGSFTAQVTVRDSLGATLGAGTGQLSIVIPQAGLTGGKDQTGEAKKAAGGCQISGTYEYRESANGIALALRQSGEQLDGTLAFTSGAETGRIDIRGSTTRGSIRLVATYEGKEMTFSGTAAEDCRSLRMSLAFDGTTQELTLVRKED